MGNNISFSANQNFHIVIVGASFGGRIICSSLLALNRDNISITLIDKAEHFEFICTNYKTLCDDETFEYLSVMNENSLTEFDGKVKFQQGLLTKVEKDQIELDGNKTIKFDALVLCTGAQYQSPWRDGTDGQKTRGERDQECKDVREQIK